MRFRVVWAWAQTGGGQLKMTQIVTRTIDRAQLLVEGGRKEWLFERNPKDGRRVSGYSSLTPIAGSWFMTRATCATRSRFADGPTC